MSWRGRACRRSERLCSAFFDEGGDFGGVGEVFGDDVEAVDLDGVFFFEHGDESDDVEGVEESVKNEVRACGEVELRAKVSEHI